MKLICVDWLPGCGRVWLRGSWSELAGSLTLAPPHLHTQPTPARAHMSLVLYRKKCIGKNSTFYSVHLATSDRPSSPFLPRQRLRRICVNVVVDGTSHSPPSFTNSSPVPQILMTKLTCKIFSFWTLSLSSPILPHPLPIRPWWTWPLNQTITKWLLNPEITRRRE